MNGMAWVALSTTMVRKQPFRLWQRLRLEDITDRDLDLRGPWSPL